MKTCSRCGATKQLTEFHRDSSSSDGARSYCKACAREYDARHYAADPEKQRQRHARYRVEHPDRVRETKARYNAANKEKISEYRARYRKENRDNIHEYNVKWLQDNPEYHAQRYEGNKERHRLLMARWYKENPEKRSFYAAKRRALELATTIGDPEEIQRIYDLAANAGRVRCYLCGKFIPKGERHVDHVVPLSKGGLHAAQNLDIACARCNLKKGAKLPEQIGMLPLVVA